MGCVNSRADINDLHPNIFQVMNVDDLGNLITPGRLEITDSDIVLYQHGKQPVKWPLRCLRRYGYDSEIFSFESGRRCSTGPGIYAFKCRRADQLFNLVQSNIQVCNSTGDDTVSRDLSITAHAAPTITRMTIAPIEANYLDPMPARSNSRVVTSRFSHNQQNGGIGRLSSVGSSSGPMSPQGTMGSPSPPPIQQTSMIASLGSAAPSSSSSSMIHQTANYNPSAVYVNDQVLSAIAMEIELDNNNKTLRRTMQRSHTVSSTSSSGFMPEPVTGSIAVNSEIKKSHSRPPPLPTTAATYINIDINNEQSPISPTHVTSSTAGQLSREESNKDSERTRHAYMNVSPGVETGLETILGRVRPNALPESLSQQSHHHHNNHHHHHPPALPASGDWEDSTRHCYANLENAEIEELRIRYNVADVGLSGRMEKSPPPLPPQPPPLPPPLPVSLPALISPTTQSTQPSTPPSSNAEPIREVNYAVLDLDKKNVTTTSTSIVSTDHTINTIPSPPDSPNKPQKGYATIDFNKTAALSHSVNPNVVNDNEGSRKTRHNSTINDLTAASRHSSSISE